MSIDMREEALTLAALAEHATISAAQHRETTGTRLGFRVFTAHAAACALSWQTW